MNIDFGIKEQLVTKPVFPLPLVIFPGGRLPLQIFETRYLDMVRECMRENSNFIVTMSRSEGFADLGCEMSIRDFDQLSNGLLGILAVGESKQQLFRPRQLNDGLWVADTVSIPAEDSVAVPNEYLGLVELLKSLQLHPAVQGLYKSINYSDSFQVGARLSELLPFETEIKQSLYELEDPLKRLSTLQTEVVRLEIRGRGD